MKRVNTHYETLGAFVADAQRKPLNESKTSRETEAFYIGWTGTKTFEDAIDMAQHGWPEGRKRLMVAMAEARGAPRMTPDMVMDVAGVYPIAALAAAGDPCSMVDLQPVEERVRPIIRLAISRNGSSAYSADEFMNYGAAVLSYVEGLENAGFRCEIVSYSATTLRNDVREYTSVTLKRAEEHIEMDRMAFCLTHPAFLRRLGFAVSESTPGIWENLGSGYGEPTNPDPGKDTDPDQIIIPGINIAEPGSKPLRSARAALETLGPMIEEQLKNRGVAPPPLVFGGEEK
jgi:hypothetical protein